MKIELTSTKAVTETFEIEPGTYYKSKSYSSVKYTAFYNEEHVVQVLKIGTGYTDIMKMNLSSLASAAEVLAGEKITSEKFYEELTKAVNEISEVLTLETV